MKYKVVFTDTAKQDLRNITYYILEESKSKSITGIFIKNIKEKCSLLEEYPKIGSIPNDYIIKNLDYRYIVFKEYIIFYTVDDRKQQIFILAIINSKRNYSKLLNKYL